MKVSPNDSLHELNVQRIETALNRTMEHLALVEGIDVNLILATSHAQVLAIIAARHGGDVAADCARRSAQAVEGLPSHIEAPLAAMAPQGRA